MKMSELQNHNPDALPGQLVELQQKYYALRETIRSGKEANHAQLKAARRDIARVQTLLRQATLA